MTRLLAAALLLVATLLGAAPARAAADTPLATPPGITLQLAGRAPFSIVVGYTLAKAQGQEWVYADAQGMTLYTYAKDEAGKSTCAGECAQSWLPAVAPARAAPTANWSVLTRDDGTAQWTYRGRPLYRFARDEKVGDVNGRQAGGGEWQPASFQPAAGMQLPPGLAVQEVGDANGQVLVNAAAQTVYLFSGDAANDGQSCTGCANLWAPVPAPELARPLGDFTIVLRADGHRQWAYKGRPLYTYRDDLEPGYANGIGIDPRWQVAQIYRYFTPPGVTIANTLAQGRVWVTATGMMIYRRDGYTYQLGGHGLRRGVYQRPHVGRDISTKGCEGDCLQKFHPLVAPADAEPQGYWEIAVRTDGTRQWVYKSFALYTYGGDTKPGDMTGLDIYDFSVSRDPQKPAYNPSRMAAAGALFWTYSYP